MEQGGEDGENRDCTPTVVGAETHLHDHDRHGFRVSIISAVTGIVAPATGWISI
jgi:hypothetical protein